MTGGLDAGPVRALHRADQPGARLLGEPVEIVISDKQSSNETAQAQLERLIKRG